MTEELRSAHDELQALVNSTAQVVEDLDNARASPMAAKATNGAQYDSDDGRSSKLSLRFRSERSESVAGSDVFTEISFVSNISGLGSDAGAYSDEFELISVSLIHTFYETSTDYLGHCRFSERMQRNESHGNTGYSVS